MTQSTCNPGSSGGIQISALIQEPNVSLHLMELNITSLFQVMQHYAYTPLYSEENIISKCGFYWLKTGWGAMTGSWFSCDDIIYTWTTFGAWFVQVVDWYGYTCMSADL